MRCGKTYSSLIETVKRARFSRRQYPLFGCLRPIFLAPRQGIIVSAVLNSWIHIGSNAYAEYTFVPWLGRSIYRRTVDLSAICVQ
jgi:hypothetical protein